MNYLSFVIGTFLSLMLMLGASDANGQTFGSFTAYPDEATIFLNGVIEPNSVGDFENALNAAASARTIVLHSPGGTVVAALEIAASISERGLVTLVNEESICASACSILFFAGRQRLALGELGVHQMSASGRSNLAGLQLVLADVLSAFDSYGVDDRVMQKMLRTPASQMHYFTMEEKTNWGVDRYAAVEPQSLRTSFANYPPDETYLGPVVFPEFNGRDEWARMFRTRIRDGMTAGVNFAGRYAVVEIGCGTSCRFAYVIDVSTGKVSRFPYGGEEQYQLGLVFASDSRMLRATWQAPSWENNSADFDTCVSQDLVWNGREFAVVHESTFTVEKYGFCSLE